METIHTVEAKALVELQKRDTALDALAAVVAGVPVKVAGLNAVFEEKKKSMGAAREALQALQVKKKGVELKIAEADESIRKHQRDLNLVKDNNAFKALLSEIEHDKQAKDGLETDELVLLEEIDKAAVQDKLIQAEVKKTEGFKDAEISALEAEGRAAVEKLAAARAERAAAAAALNPDLLERYESLRANRKGLAVAAVHEEAGTGKLSCGGCHMSLTPQKTLDVKKADTLTFCQDCRCLLYLEKTIFG
jgi:predicted  nucleic acid-binding Zn-ribbon protein